MFSMQTRRDPRATFDTYTGCQQRACHYSALGAPSHAQTQDNSDEQLRFKVLYEEKRVCDLWEHACPQSFVNKLCMALNTRASASDRTTRVSRRVRACMLSIVSTRVQCIVRARLHCLPQGRVVVEQPRRHRLQLVVVQQNNPAGGGKRWSKTGQ